MPNNSTYLKYKAYYIAYHAKGRRELRQLLTRYKESKPCSDCGDWFPAHVMDFDHIAANKRNEVSRLCNNFNKKQMWQEIEKCDLVCANCHRKRTHKRKQYA